MGSDVVTEVSSTSTNFVSMLESRMLGRMLVIRMGVREDDE